VFNFCLFFYFSLECFLNIFRGLLNFNHLLFNIVCVFIFHFNIVVKFFSANVLYFLECTVGIAKVDECSCTSNSHCLFDNTECRNGHCQCTSGYTAYENGLACRKGLFNVHHLWFNFACFIIFFI